MANNIGLLETLVLSNIEIKIVGDKPFEILVNNTIDGIELGPANPGNKLLMRCRWERQDCSIKAKEIIPFPNGVTKVIFDDRNPYIIHQIKETMSNSAYNTQTIINLALYRKRQIEILEERQYR